MNYYYYFCKFLIKSLINLYYIVNKMYGNYVIICNVYKSLNCYYYAHRDNNVPKIKKLNYKGSLGPSNMTEIINYQYKRVVLILSFFYRSFSHKI